ncbi:PKD domain-containing protein [Pricia sp. S334]|uniref:PKD domain-containing protein n=1 Tax=Pricia mediterranea TaxID=3076079 RepID=A0ABU3LAJ1_9FLAO|nr:PKD domain-containing protein [Pricia sp. S334]MDT7830214.1 PKD domain-containing protein [Pricia sp. S334]
MNLLPTKTVLRFFCLIIFGLAFTISCSKDDEDDEVFEAIDKTEVAKKVNATAASRPITAVISGTLRGGALPSTGKAPFKVAFKSWNSKNQDDIESYFWDFNDGSTTRTKNPSHTFTKPGDYRVKLTVKTKGGFTHSTTENITITGSGTTSKSESSNINIAAKISGSIPSSGRAPLTVNFKAWNSTNQNYIKGYFWDFKDGSTTTTKNPTHTFRKSGTFEVELSVKNAQGQTHSVTRTITITGSSSTSGNSGGGSSSDGGSSSSDGGSSSSGSSSNGSSSSSGNYPSHAVKASSFGFRSGDATAAFEAAIKSGSSYVVIDKQSSDWVIRPTRFYNLRNMTIVFEPGVTLRAKSGAFRDGNRLFELVNSNNITVEGTGATFRMNKSEYTSGEQRHTFGISRSTNITVRGLTLRDSGGSGIYIVGDGGSGYSQNITLENIRSLNHRRDGITITSAQDVWVRNSVFSGSSGTKPEAGVVLESDRSSQRLVNINFENCKFSGNNNAGVHFSTTRMNGSSRAVSVKVVDSEFSNNGVSPSSSVMATEIYVGGGKGNYVVGGEIRFERNSFNGSRGRIVFTRKSGDGFKAVFKDCEATNVVGSTSGSPIRIEGSSDRNTAGGMVFDNFHIQYNRNVPFMHINAPSRNGSFDIKNVSGSFTIKEPNNNPLKYSGGYKPSKNVNVSVNYRHI